MNKKQLIEIVLTRYPELSLKQLQYHLQSERMNYNTIKRYYYEIMNSRVNLVN